MLLLQWQHLLADDEEQGSRWDVTMRGGAAWRRQCAHGYGSSSFHLIGTSARILILLPWPGQCDPWKHTKKYTQRDPIKKYAALKQSTKAWRGCSCTPPHPPQPLASLSLVAGPFSRVIYEKSEKHVHVFQTKTPEPFGYYTGPSLLSFFRLLKSIYPSSLVRTKCHRIPRVR